ncbi:MAG TPA: hypothetical protein VG328_10730 [Stellaceae bacterium]|jgi:hypothetical protein|nr:hypothetical protein [Stellaceae bacterium]
MRLLMGLLAAAAMASAASAAPLILARPAAAPALVQPVADMPADKNADDTDFLFRLGMMEGHLIIGHELLVNNETALALPHFGHPVRELYDDVGPYLDRHHFPGFDKQLIALEAAVMAAPAAKDTEDQYLAMIATLHKARDLAPARLRASVPEMIQICSDTIDAASGEFGESLQQGKISSLVEYHDSRGFLEYVAEEVKGLAATHGDAASQALIDRFKPILAKAQYIVADLIPAPTPRASVTDYRAIAAQAEGVGKSSND